MDLEKAEIEKKKIPGTIKAYNNVQRVKINLVWVGWDRSLQRE